MNLYCRLICLFLISYSAVIFSEQKSPYPKISDAEMRQLETEMAAFQKEIDALSPSEQEAFFKSMEEAVQKIDNLSKTEEGKALLDKLDRGELSDEELDNLINQIVEEPVAKPEPTPAPVASKPVVTEKPAPKPVITSKQQAAADMVNDLINHTNSFTVKAAITHDLPGRVKSWRKKGIINWMPNLTWNKLKTEIEKFAQQLNLLLEKDPKTKTFIHIDNLIANESVYNNMKKVHQIISTYEPKIEELLPLSGTMSGSSKKAFQKIINQYVEALYTLNLPTAIKDIVAAFEPSAKKLREEEEAIRKKTESSYRRPVPMAPIVAGTGYEDEYFPIPAEVESFPSQGGYAATPRSVERFKPEFGESPSLEKQPAGAGANPVYKGGKEQPEQEKEEGKKDQEKSSFEKLKEQAEEADKKLFADAEKLLKKIKINLENAADTIKKSPILEDIKTHLTSDVDIDIEFATEVLPELIRDLSLRKGALGNIKQMEGKLPAGAFNAYKEKLQELYDKYGKEFDSVLDQLNKLESDWESVAPSISSAKKYAYFATQEEKPSEQPSQENIDALLQQAVQSSKSIDEGLKKAVEATKPTEATTAIDQKLEEAQRKVPAPYSLKELQKDLVDLKSAIEKFGDSQKKKKKSPARRRA